MVGGQGAERWEKSWLMSRGSPRHGAQPMGVTDSIICACTCMHRFRPFPCTQLCCPALSCAHVLRPHAPGRYGCAALRTHISKRMNLEYSHMNHVAHIVLIGNTLFVPPFHSGAAARAARALRQRVRHAHQRHEVPTQLLRKGAAAEDVLPVPGESVRKNSGTKSQGNKTCGRTEIA